MTRDIITNLEVIKQSVAWADKYEKDSFPREVFKNYRRKLRRIGEALSENCSAAAYGESQVGKSYLMSSLLSTPDAPFVIENNGVRYSFIDEINPSGGNNTKQESTGVITRFTIRQSNKKMADYVKITNLSVVDIILLLADSYYNDVKINTDSVMLNTDIDNSLSQMKELWSGKSPAHNIITVASDILFMQRGQSKSETGKEHLERNDFIIEKQKAELQRIDETKRHKEQQIGLAEQELRQVKSEIRTDKLKSVATDAATAIASGVGSLFGSGKLKELERTNEDLYQEIAKRDKGIDALKIQMQEMQERHGKQIRNLQSIHNQELEAKDREISRLNTLLEKAFKWFPMLREMLRMEKLCAVIGFTKDMIDCLLTKKEAIQCNGKIYSEEHRRKFEIKNDIFKVEKNPTDGSKLVLTINKQPIGEWFKEQWEKLRQGLRQSAEEPRKSRGFKL